MSTSRIDLSWTASSDNVGVVEYSIRRDGVAIATTADTNYADTGLLANTTYSFEVIALDVERLDVGDGFGLEALRAALEGHVLGRAKVTGTYTQNPALR